MGLPLPDLPGLRACVRACLPCRSHLRTREHMRTHTYTCTNTPTQLHRRKHTHSELLKCVWENKHYRTFMGPVQLGFGGPLKWAVNFKQARMRPHMYALTHLRTCMCTQLHTNSHTHTLTHLYVHTIAHKLAYAHTCRRCNGSTWTRG